MAEAAADYDLVGIGAGPANLSLASLLYRHREVSNLFLDRRPVFSWHDGQQIPDTTLQVSALKDLVTLADPTSDFSFISYLHQKGRLYHYINARFDAVTRREFRDYLEWASARNENVVFGEDVRSVAFDGMFVVETDRRTVRAANIALGIGRQAWVPAFARRRLGRTQFHVSDFTDLGRGVGGKRVCVVGGGQSGAEAFLDLLSRPAAELPRRITWVSRRFNYFPIDDSPFTNDLYTPDFSDFFYGLEAETRAEFNEQQVLSSDGISETTLREIYQLLYTRKFIDEATDLVSLRPHREVSSLTATGSGWELSLTSCRRPGPTDQVEADVVVWATGQRATPPDLLAPLAGRLEHSGEELRVGQDFAVQWDGPDDRNIFLQNGAVGQRGLADKNLSLVAWRSQRIIDRLRGSRSDEPQPSFLDWQAKWQYGRDIRGETDDAAR